jgi:hypothetical protein
VDGENYVNLYWPLNIRVVDLRQVGGGVARRGRCKQNFSRFT